MFKIKPFNPKIINIMFITMFNCEMHRPLVLNLKQT
uniref:Uncharacterized protein n=1 Tax=Anguilla anguilla TaxID=7936 RepID=A0A0E9WFZ5_ANGAN